MTRNGRQYTVSFGAKDIQFRLIRSRRRTLAIAVKPDTSVVVTAPRKAIVDAIKKKVRKRAIWIRRQQEYFSRFLPTMPPPRFLSGETHRYLGRQYRLKVRRGDPESVKLKGQFIWVQTNCMTASKKIRDLVHRWYAIRAKERFQRSLTECLPRFHGSVEAPRLSLRRMPKRWGSWTRKGIIYLNPELVKAPPSCIDYVITHELCHVVHGNHGATFYALLRRVMPDWEQRKARLEKSISS